MRLRILMGCVVALLAFPPQHAHAQSDPRVTLSFRGTPLDRALAQLVARTQLDLTFAPEVVENRHSYCEANEVTPESALRCVLGGTGLDFYRLSNGMYVVRLARPAPQRQGGVQGTVRDAATGMALPRASVLLDDGKWGAAADHNGRFAFADLAPGLYRMRVSYVGYRPYTDTVRVTPAGLAHPTVSLERMPAPILPVIVDGLRGRGTEELALGTGLLFGLAPPGTSDLVYALAQLPGVQVGNVTADVHVQGGAAGEHDLRLDGAPVFSPPLLLNLIGPFSPFAIGQIEVEKAGFGPLPGSNTVGVVEATQLVHPTLPARFDAQLDALSLNMRFLGSHRLGATGSGQFMSAVRVGVWQHYRPLAARRFLDEWNQPDAFLRTIFATPAPGADASFSLPADEPAGRAPTLDFRDLHLVYQARFSPRHTVHLSGYLGERALATDAPTRQHRDAFNWSTYMLQARYATVLSPHVFAQVQLRTSRYKQRHHYALVGAPPTDPVLQPEDDGNTLTESAIEAKLDIAPFPGALIELGVAPVTTTDHFTVRSVQGQAIKHRAWVERVATYLTAGLRPTRWMQAELGFRATYVLDRARAYPEPRVALRFDTPSGRLGQLSMRFGAGLYEQFVGQYQVSSPSPRALVSTSRVWMAMDASVEPPRAEHYSAEMRYAPGRGWAFDFDTYYKHQLRLYAINYSAALPENSGAVVQRTFMESGEGYAWGIGGAVEKRWTSGSRIGAQLHRSHVERGTALFNFNYYVVPWNEPWQLEGTADLALTPRFVVLARWQSIWGRRWGFRQAYYDYLTASGTATSSLTPELQTFVARHVQAYDLRNPVNNALPAYHRLDLGAAYTVSVGGAQIQYRLDALNLLDRPNVAERQLVRDAAYYAETGLLLPHDRHLLPFTLVWAVRLTL